MANDVNVNLFARQATGLVRHWSVFDAFIYSFFSINLITLGFYIFSSAPNVPNGQLIPALVVSALFILFEVGVYAMMISVMPRAGGDYVWQSRILGGGLGFVLAMTGWVLILWMWIPVYGSLLSYDVLTPILAILSSIGNSAGLAAAAVWFTSQTGLFLSSLLVILFAFVVIGIGMKWYARIQKISFFVGVLGLFTVFVMLAASTPAHFAAEFNRFSQTVFGVKDSNTYQSIIALAAKGGYKALPFGHMPLMASLPLIPLLLFFNLWPNWGSTLYGEVRGASEFRKNFWGMAAAVIITTVLAIVLVALLAKGIGWDFYNTANFAFWSGKSPLPVFPFLSLYVSFLTQNPLLQLWLVLSMSAWFFGWAGTVFLSSTRVLFAAAFDRVLPDWIAEVSPKHGTPFRALLVMVVPSVVLSALYAYSPTFAKMTLDTTVVIAITYLGTTIAAMRLPVKDPELFRASPIAKYKIGNIPVITIISVVFGLFLLWNIYMWLAKAVYGVNDPLSAVFMLLLYVIALVYFLISKNYRKKQGIDLSLVQKTIPIE
ncbi:Amino acid/polyamine transporter I [Acididesulfobacillus acetoxydans]|uniref:Amino acid permease-associated region n=1 Tax=Acididesulfobacillus acetoxydans TaxID=1561005 RepID=A0A8S0WF30_9FIRM|nr:APC family permease [Acididesulfobacillus acetoxydans]CAA7600622.1 Amino acid/polyamine transporter I [Acididesulfobacillus acetoxydans]CEJ09403.1 Amino acid permease-associated region [Acididesulfobacillus acetoxydans]